MWGRANGFRLGLVAVLAFWVSAIALRPPTPKPANAPADQFSAERALTDVRAIATAPHPVGSARQAEVRAYLLARMTALGLSPQAHPVFSDTGPAANLIGVLPGKDRQGRGVMLMAHYDSVPAGPGAADDGAGVAAALETVRAIKASGVPGRDVLVLLTDSEEKRSMGAGTFFEGDKTYRRVGVAINLEARGDKGRAVMFETHPHAGAMIGMLVGAHALSGASSLMPDLYRRLPNGTDLTWAIRTGHRGLNFAFFSGIDAYHQPLDTPDRLDPGSLKSLGDQALAAARAFLPLTVLPAGAPDLVYGDLLGGPDLAYPAWVGWGLVAMAAALLGLGLRRALTDGLADVVGLTAGAFAFLGLIVSLGAIFTAVMWARGALTHQFIHHEALAWGVMVLLIGAIGVAWRRLIGKLTPTSLWLGALILVLILAVVLQALAPLDAFILQWPLLAGALCAALPAHGFRIIPVLSLAVCAQAFYWTGLMFALVGQTMPAALAPFAALAVLALLPLAPGRTDTSRA